MGRHFRFFSSLHIASNFQTRVRAKREKSVYELDGLVPEGWTLAKQIIKKAGCYVCIRSYLRLIAFLACVVTRTQTTRYGDLK